MAVNELNYKQLKFLGDGATPKITLENMATHLGRSYSGFLKAIEAGTIYAHELGKLAELLNMDVPSLLDALTETENEAAGSVSRYIKTRKLSDVADPLEWVRLAMTKSPQLDELIRSVKK